MNTSDQGHLKDFLIFMALRTICMLEQITSLRQQIRYQTIGIEFGVSGPRKLTVLSENSAELRASGPQWALSG